MLAVVWDISWSHQPEHPPVASPHGGLRVTGLFTWWLRAPKSPTFLKHFPINQSHSSSRPQRKQYIKHWVFFTYLLIFYKSHDKAGITTLYKKKGKMTVMFRDMLIIIQVNDKVTFKLRLFLYMIKIIMKIKLAKYIYTIFL